MTPNKKILLAHVGVRIAAQIGRPVPSNRKFHDHALRGSFPATFEGGRWHVLESDIPLVAAALGLSPARAHEKTAA